MNLQAFWGLIKATAGEWWNDNTFRLAASLAFYTIFSLAPIVGIAIAIAGAVFGEEAAVRQLVQEVEGLVGEQGGRAVREVIESTREAGSRPLAATFGIITLILGSTAVFAELQSALNQIWDVETTTERGMLISLVRTRLLSFAMVLGVGFLLLVSLLASALLSGAQAYLAGQIPLLWLWRGLNLIVSFALVSLLFMMIYKVLPDVRITWRDVAVGAVVTAALFTIGKFASASTWDASPSAAPMARPGPSWCCSSGSITRPSSASLAPSSPRFTHAATARASSLRTTRCARNRSRT